MKRLLTIFLSSIVCLGLWGQLPKLPMTVFGDVYIDEGGIVNSVGPVHVKAPSVANTGKINVTNKGKLNVNSDSIIFYTNDVADGLLMNVNAPDSVNVKGVVVRKNFVLDTTWYQISFPVDVDLRDGVINPLNGKVLEVNEEFWVQVYNSQKRADRGKNDKYNWEILDEDSLFLRKGVAYRIQVSFEILDPTYVAGSPNTYDLAFVATTESINPLFTNTLKGLDLIYTTATIKFATTYCEGWNPFGGLNSSLIQMSAVPGALPQRTIEYDRTVYFWSGQSADYEEFLPTDPSIVGTLRPYGVIWVKTDDTFNEFLKFDLFRAARYGGFAYFKEGVSLDNGDPALTFRSSQANSINLIKLLLTNKKDNISSPAYFKFDNSHSRFYKESEDDMMLQLNKTQKPVVWSIALRENQNINEIQKENNVFVNSLPFNVDGEIPLGVNIPAAGDYVFSMKNFANGTINSVVLWDKVTDKKVDLFAYDYPFQTTGELIENIDRFVLFFNQVITTIDPALPDTEIFAYAENNVLTVKNLRPGDKVQVFDLTGRIFASGIAASNTFFVPLNQKGVYLVNAREGGKILKVINK